MFKRLLGLLIFITSASVLPGGVAAASSSRDEVALASYYSPAALNYRKNATNVTDRAMFFAQVFLRNKSPYLADPLGEGETGQHSRQPLYRFDGFDCTTFVETVLALGRADSAAEFKTLINQIRYKNGEVSYVTRNHFISLDWIPNNTAAGFIEDITGKIAGRHTNWAQTWIDKKSWYLKKSLEFHSFAKGFEKELAQIPYISNKDLFTSPELVDRIPSGSIFTLVRQNWNVAAALGTDLDVSHQGFLIREKGILYMVHASNALDAAVAGSDEDKGKKTKLVGVTKEPMVSYIKRIAIDKTTSMVGFNIVRIKDK